MWVTALSTTLLLLSVSSTRASLSLCLQLRVSAQGVTSRLLSLQESALMLKAFPFGHHPFQAQDDLAGAPSAACPLLCVAFLYSPHWPQIQPRPILILLSLS